MLLSQIVQALAGSQASKLILKQQSLLVLCSKQFLSCRNCQRVRLLSSFSNSNCVYTASFSKNGMKSRKLSSNVCVCIAVRYFVAVLFATRIDTVMSSALLIWAGGAEVAKQ